MHNSVLVWAYTYTWDLGCVPEADLLCLLNTEIISSKSKN